MNDSDTQDPCVPMGALSHPSKNNHERSDGAARHEIMMKTNEGTREEEEEEEEEEEVRTGQI